MARITSDIAERQIGNRFLMVLMAAQRARELSRGAPQLMNTKHDHALTALLEFEHGYIDGSLFDRVGERLVKKFRPIK